MRNKDKSSMNPGKEWRERSEPLLAVPEDESEHPPHSLPRLSVVMPASTSSSFDNIPARPKRRPLSHGDESMTVVLSAFYAKLIIVLGVALPVTSTIQNELYTNITTDVFTMYLYVVSMIFLAYTFYHLRIAKMEKKKENVKRTRYGSFYLHIGVAGFSVGSIIYSCLQFGGYFDLSGDCQMAIVALKPALRILFMVAQTVFIFSYTDILDPMRGVVLDRFGLMHLIATNVCEWLNVVIQETRDDIVAVAYDRPALLRYANISGPTQTLTVLTTQAERINYNETLLLTHNKTVFEISHDVLSNSTVATRDWMCNVSNMISPLIRSANPYLRPCGVEYSLLCSVIILVIWNDLCTVPGSILDPMRGVVLDRFGLMHLIATNVCEWLNVVIQETRDDIVAVAYDRPALLRYANISGPTQTLTVLTTQAERINYNETLLLTHNKTVFEISHDVLSNSTVATRDWMCNVSNMISPLIRSANPYLRPCGVEYSLLCSVIILVIWNDLCTVPGSKFIKNPTTNNQMFGKESRQCCARPKSNSHFSVDCGSAHKGLFVGIAVLAGTIVSLMLFNGLFHNKDYVELALLQVNVWETILFVLMTLGSAACLQRMRTLPIKKTVYALPLEHSLLLVTQCGVYLYYLFQIIGAGFVIQKYPEGRRATRILSPLCAVIQSSCQTLLVLDSWSRRSAEVSGGKRPGRQLITFLLVGNFALWLLNRVKNARAEFHPLQMEFFGVWAWTLITHVSVPLLVCYRFQATVCFYEIWKNSYKRNKDADDIDLNDIELKNYHIA